MPKSALHAVLPGFVATRLVLFAVAALAVLRLPLDTKEAQGFHLSPQPHAFLEAWARYDACWYVAIAERGYRESVGPSDMRAAFFPLFPALIATVTPLVRIPLVAGLIVANTCYLIFLTLLWRIVRLDWTIDVARRALWIYLLFPSAFFLSGAYSESLLLMLTAGSVLMVRQRRWLHAGALAGFATLSRPIGLVAVVPILAEYFATRRGPCGERSWQPLAQGLVPVLVAGVGYLCFAWWAFGDPLANLAMETAVRGKLDGPWRPFVEMWRAGPRLHVFNNSLVDATLAATAIATLPAIFTKVRPSYGWYALLVVLIPVSGSLMSFNRLLLPSFPHAILLARAMNRTSTTAFLLVPLGLLEAVLTATFATWHWVA